jgi:hypothetical protein
MLDRGVPHDLESLQESTLLLTIAWAGEKREPIEDRKPYT